jgi:hypothetical protein
MMRKAFSALSVLGLSAGLLVGVAGQASAYPPGSTLNVTAAPNPVSVNAVVVATARHVKPGCQIRFVLGSATVTVGTWTGTVSARLRAPSTGGTRTLSATTVNCGYAEVAYTRVKVNGPAVVAPAVVKAGRLFTVMVERFPARSWVIVKLTRGSTSIVQRVVSNNLGRAAVRFRVSQVGTYAVTAISRRVHASDVVRVVH